MAKEKLLANKKYLPPGIYINKEYLPHIKHNRDLLHPILKLATSIPAYKDKSKLKGDIILVINGIRYSAADVGKLPTELAAYKAAQKEDDNNIVFHGELSLFLNFHQSPFVMNNQHFATAEHLIQYQKALMFSDSFTANQILYSDTLYEAKHLSRQIQGMDNDRWLEDRNDICLEGVCAKFQQNSNLNSMLLTTHPKILA